ncbi:AMP-binding protein [Vibrio mytili]|uniref:AMP-binding protein n=1 Tax=Vibrio mytili TaxID=50718 RepID=UPI002F3EA69E
MNTLLDTIKNWAMTQPEHLAFVGKDDTGKTVQLTYSELFDQIQYAASQLKAHNVKVLALRAENNINWAIIDLAAMAANIVVVPIPMFFSDSQIRHILIQSNVDTLLGDWNNVALPDGIIQPTPNEQLRVSGLPLTHTFAKVHAPYLEGTGKITFTSGSTGQPKGVCLSNEHLFQVATSLSHAVKGLAQSHLVLLPLSTLLENITGVYVPLILGVTATILPGKHTGLMGSSHFDTSQFTKTLAEVKPDSLVLTPALLLALIHIVKTQPTLALSLKFVAVGGARVSSQLISAARALNIPAFEGYGLSECGSVVCLNTPSEFKPGTCGKPLPHIQTRIADDGELFVKGSIALGYLNEPFHQEWLATGDLAQIDDQGYITLSGRKKNLIVTAYGRNVSPEWVESEALAFLPNTPLIVTGDDQQALCAIVTKSEGLEEKISALNSTLPDYARIQVLLVMDNPQRIPSWYTENGKLKRDAIERSISKWLAHDIPKFTLEGEEVQRIDLSLQSSIAS